MTTSSIASLDTTSLTQNSALQNSQSAASEKDMFTKMLVAQLQNQDPMAPQDNSAFVAQLAQFSSLEQMQQLNQNIMGLAVLQQTNATMSQLTQSSALIGQNVQYTDPQSNQTLTGTVDMVKLVNGVASLEINGTDVPLGNVTEILGPAGNGSGSDSSGSGSGGSGS